MLKIFVIGMPGSGKTTLGKKLSKKLQINFVDLDKEIEKSEKTSINEIFSNYGEDRFRKIERECLEVVIKKMGSFVMATGGGAACFFDNLEIMKSEGITIFLDVSAEELCRRLTPHISHRPLLKDKSDAELLEELKAKLESRRVYYENADIVIKDDNISISDILEAIERKSLR